MFSAPDAGPAGSVNGPVVGQGHMDRGPAPAQTPTARCGRSYATQLTACRGAVESPRRRRHIWTGYPGADCLRHGTRRRICQCDATGSRNRRAPRDTGAQSLADQLRQGAIHQPAGAKGRVVHPALFGCFLFKHRDNQLLPTLSGAYAPVSSVLPTFCA